MDIDVLGRQVTCEFISDGKLYQTVFPDAKALVVVSSLAVVVLGVGVLAATIMWRTRPGRALAGGDG